MAYTHLALEERYHIYSLAVQGLGPHSHRGGDRTR